LAGVSDEQRGALKRFADAIDETTLGKTFQLTLVWGHDPNVDFVGEIFDFCSITLGSPGNPFRGLDQQTETLPEVMAIPHGPMRVEFTAMLTTLVPGQSDRMLAGVESDSFSTVFMREVDPLEKVFNNTRRGFIFLSFNAPPLLPEHIASGTELAHTLFDGTTDQHK
jgi:hypothetical protein